MYRQFIDELVARRNARNAQAIDVERAELKALPARRTTDYEDVILAITSIWQLIDDKIENENRKYQTILYQRALIKTYLPIPAYRWR